MFGLSVFMKRENVVRTEGIAMPDGNMMVS